jgi:hypothetical protein
MFKNRFLKFALVVGLTLIVQLAAFAQGTTGSIAGSVKDSNDAAIPNATVVVKGAAGQEFTAVTSSNGTYAIPAIATGLYTVTVTAPNFKKGVVENVKVDVGTPTTTDVVLQAGDISETVVVTSGGEVLQTQTSAVATTITGRQITETPLTSRDALDLVTLLPGTAQVGRPRASSINGLPKGSLSITIDGVDVQDNLLKSSDGFFTFVRPRLDAIDEVNVSTAAGGADSGGDGAVQIRFVTRRGTNDYRGSLFWQHRDQSLNSNYFYNNLTGQSRNPINLNQYGGSFSGPIPFLRPGDGGKWFDSGKDKAFFFVNYEEFRIPESTPRQRTILTPDAASGIFRYGANSVNLLQIAQNAGLPNTIDPTVGSLLSAIRSATGQGVVSATANPNTQFFDFIAKTKSQRRFLTMRYDFNLHKNHALEVIWNRNIFGSGGAGGFDLLNNRDPSFPGFPNFGDQRSRRYSTSIAVRSTLTNNLVNEARYARLYGSSVFGPGLSPAQFQNQGGYNLNFNFTNPGVPTAYLGLTNVTAGTASNVTGFSQTGSSDNRRGSPNWDLSDNLTWIKGNHAFTFGGQYKQVKLNTASINQIVPLIYFGLDASDPADAIFNATTLPGASAAQLVQAKGLYALLTGRVTDILQTAFLNSEGTYELRGDQFQSGKQVVYGLYAQDSWKIRPNLTLSYGVRWQPQDVFTPETENFSYASSFADVFGVSGVGNLFKPGTLTGRAPTFSVVGKGFQPYKADKNNFAPSVGVVYSPEFGDSGFLRKIFGASGDSVFRAGFQRAFVREGTNVALTILSSSPGATLDASRNVSLGTLPVGTLFRNIGSITPPSFPQTPPSSITGTFNDAVTVFDPNIKTGYVDSWSVGYQRQLDKNTVVEARYVANRGRDLWRMYNLNEINVTENGFVNEFRLAQANLIANNASGVAARIGSYAYFGPGTGTSPLPILQAFFRGAGDPNNAAQYTSALYRNTTLTAQLSTLVPNVRGFATNIENSATRRNNALAAGLPSNFFYVNPTVLGGGAFLVDNSNSTSYDALQIELRRRLSNGLLVQGSYTFSKSLATSFAGQGDSRTLQSFRTLRNRDLDKVLSPYDVTHAFKANFIYELPFGQGQPFFSGVNRWMNFLVGGWSLIGAVKLQSGTPINFGNVNLVGMDRKELEKAVKVYFNQTVRYGTTAAPTTLPVSYLPVDIIENTFRAFNLEQISGRAIVPAAYGGCVQEFVGQCGFSNLIVHGPKFFRTDLSLSKKFKFDEKRSVELRAAAYNALNNTQFRVGGWAADVVNVTAFGTGFGNLTTGSAYLDTSTTNDQGGRTIELILRINF